LDLIQEQLTCWITRTTEKTTEIVQKNLSKLPVFDSGEVRGRD
jgi:tRNA U34 5-carboxymethylaminomethyl modifying enzyme MnmG/GidA